MRTTTSIRGGLAAVTLALGVAFASSGAAWAQDTPQTPSRSSDTSNENTQTTSGRFTIQHIDKNNRMLTFTDQAGGTLDMKAGPDVNIDKLSANQKVDVTFFDEVPLSIQKHGEQPKTAGNEGQRQGATAKQATVTARVDSVDADKNTVTVHGPTGATHTIDVRDPNLQAQLKQFKSSDKLDLTYMQAMATAVKPEKEQQQQQPDKTQQPGKNQQPDKTPQPPDKNQ